MYSEMNSDAFTQVSTDRLYRLYEVRAELSKTYGTRFWRYIRNMSGGALAIGQGVAQETGLTVGEVIASGANCSVARFQGVVQHEIASESYAWVLADGAGCKLLAGVGDIPADEPLQCLAAGAFTLGAAGADELPVYAQEVAVAGSLATGIVRAL